MVFVYVLIFYKVHAVTHFSLETGAFTNKMTTSFKKRSRAKVLQVSGAKPSLYNNQLLISTGIPSLDQVLGNAAISGRREHPDKQSSDIIWLFGIHVSLHYLHRD